jgi:three-Cys-motif partner protein
MKDFGGGWTEKKLEKVNSYLKAYMRALKNKNFKKIYIDAFAGEGYRGSNHDNCHDEEKLLGLEELEDLDAAKVLKAGSAIVALKIKPPFDKYIFIEKEQEKCAKLKDIIKSDYAELEDRAEIIQDDANHALRIICKNMGNYDRAVLFLDPFGMQVEWSTIEIIAKTQKIDMWYLFPSGIAVNRLLPHDAQLNPANIEKLDKLFGSHDWYNRFYEKRKNGSLFDDDEESYARIANLQNIKEYLIEKLKSIFPGVASNPLQLTNSKNVELYLLCFACSNKAGAPVALRIANYILQNF